MIRLRRPAGNVPEVLSKNKVIRAKAAIAGRVAADGSPGDIPAHWQDYDLRAQLWKLQHKKCGFTERHRRWKLEMDVEHYRPKKGVDDEAGHPGYWWLAYSWHNYLLTDKHSNSIHKGNAFPLCPGGIRSWGPTDPLDVELPMLINPFADDPENFLTYEEKPAGDVWWVYARGTDTEGRGDASITIYGLNEHELVEERGELVDSLRDLQSQLDDASHSRDRSKFTELSRRVRNETNGTYAFTGYRRDFLRRAGYGAILASL